MDKKVDSMILDDFTWSYSRIETYERCPLCFNLQYIKCYKGIDGVFGQYGSLMHDILEDYLNGKLAEYELSEKYKDNFDKKVTEYFPKNAYVDLREKYYTQGLEYFDTFAGFDDLNILGVENEYFFKIGDYNFTGKVDMETDSAIIDHKSKAGQHLKRLNKNHVKEDYVTMDDGRFVHKDNFKQLYVYCIPYYEKHGHYPQKLQLNMVRIGDWYSIDFNMEDFERAKSWVLTQIDRIYKDNVFEKGDDVGDYWCNNVCGSRIHCVHSAKYMGLEDTI